MKNALRSLFAPVLNVFEKGTDEYVYKPSHRTILLVVGTLFAALAAFGLWLIILTNQPAASLPVVIFFAVAAVCWIVGFLGTDKAVAKIWKSR